MNISMDKLLEIFDTLSRVDERTVAIEKNIERIEDRMEAYQTSFDERLDDVEERLKGVEGWKYHVIGFAAGAAFIVSMVWNFAGDYIKSRALPSQDITIQSVNTTSDKTPTQSPHH